MGPLSIEGNVGGTTGSQLNVQSKKPAQEGTYPVSVTAVLTVANNNGVSTTFTLDQYSDTVTFDNVVTNPCKTTAIDAITGWTSPLTVVDGNTAYTEWAPPQTALDAYMNDVELCGPREFEVFLSNTNTAFTPTYTAKWATISQPTLAAVFRLTVDTLADLTIIDNEASKDIILYVRTTLTDWPTNTRYDPITITVQQTTCQCSHLAWVNPSATAATVSVGTPGTPTLPIPTPDDGLRTSVPEFEKCYSAGTPCSTQGQIAGAASITIDSGDGNGIVAMPAWLAISTVGTHEYNALTQPVTVTPTYEHIGTHTIYVTFTAASGQTPNYAAITLTVDCTVTGFTRPADPTAGLAYTLFAKTLEIDLVAAVEQAYVQTPACNYPYTAAPSWTGTNSWITTNAASNFILDVQTNDKANSGYPATQFADHAISLAVVLTLPGGNNGGTTSFQLNAAPDLVSFNIRVTNPCWTATIDALSFSANPLPVTDGQTASATWAMPLTSTDHSTGLVGACGSMTFGVYTNANGGDTAPANGWATIGYVPGTWSLDVDTTRDLSLIFTQASVTHNLFIKVVVDDYNTLTEYQPIDVTIGEASCDCQWLLWVDPTATSETAAVGSTSQITVPPPTQDTSNRSVYTAFDKCYLTSQDCSSAGQFSSITYGDATTALPAWITFTSTGVTAQQISITPTYADIGAHHTLYVVFTTSHGPDPAYMAINLAVTCVVTSFSLPAAPLQAATTYTAYDTALPIAISPAGYIQSPACGYAFTAAFTWTGFNSDIRVDTLNGGQVNVYSRTPALSVGTVAMTVRADLTIADNGGTINQVFPHNNAQIAFDVIIVDPCTTTTINTIGTFTAQPLIITDGSTGFATWSDPTTALDDAHGATGLCGGYSYSVVEVVGGIDTALATPWAVVEQIAGVYRLSVDTNVDLDLIANQASVDYALYIKSTLTEYPTIDHKSLITVRIEQAVCDCQWLLWNAPSTVTVDVMVAAPTTTSPLLAVPTPDSATNMNVKPTF